MRRGGGEEGWRVQVRGEVQMEMTAPPNSQLNLLAAAKSLYFYLKCAPWSEVDVWTAYFFVNHFCLLNVEL